MYLNHLYASHDETDTLINSMQKAHAPVGFSQIHHLVADNDTHRYP